MLQLCEAGMERNFRFGGRWNDMPSNGSGVCRIADCSGAKSIRRNGSF